MDDNKTRIKRRTLTAERRWIMYDCHLTEFGVNTRGCRAASNSKERRSFVNKSNRLCFRDIDKYNKQERPLNTVWTSVYRNPREARSDLENGAPKSTNLTATSNLKSSRIIRTCEWLSDANILNHLIDIDLNVRSRNDTRDNKAHSRVHTLMCIAKTNNIARRKLWWLTLTCSVRGRYDDCEQQQQQHRRNYRQ